MAASVSRTILPANISHSGQLYNRSNDLGSTALLEIVQTCLHTRESEWIFLRELRVVTGFHGSAAQRLDAFALNCLPHTSMKRVCYEVKTSRADFLCEMKRPLKRRIGLRYSNEFYFVTPPGLVNLFEIPVECGLVEVGIFTDEERNSILAPFGMFVHFDPNHHTYCRVTVPAPGEKRRGRRGNLLQVCCGTSKRSSRVDLRNNQINNAYPLSTESGM